MSKYIDAEKLKKLISEKYCEFRLKGFKEDPIWYHYADGLDFAKQLIDSLQQEQPPRGYDEAYLNECIAKASKTWEGVDADKYLDEVRGREREQPEVDLEKEEFVGVVESPLKTFPRVNDFECGGSYRH